MHVVECVVVKASATTEFYALARHVAPTNYVSPFHAFTSPASPPAPSSSSSSSSSSSASSGPPRPLALPPLAARLLYSQ